MAELHLSLDDALIVHDRAVQNRIAAEHSLDARLATGESPILDDGLDLRDNLFASELVELAAAQQVARLRLRDHLSGVTQK